MNDPRAAQIERAPRSPTTRGGPRLFALATNQRCNQACTYCNRRSEHDDLAAIAAVNLQKRIAEALRSGVEEIRLTGGEPTMRRDLPALVAFSKRSGALRVSLETNATLVDDAMARALREAGLTLARVNAIGLDPRADTVTRDPGGAERMAAGLRALLRAGIAVEVRAVLTTATAPLLAGLPRALADAAVGDARVRALEIAVPVDGPADAGLMAYEACLEPLARLDAACQEVGLPLALARDSGPPPCVFPSRRGVAHLYALTPGGRHAPGHTQLPACQACVLADRCPGISTAYLQRRGPPAMTPIADVRERRRLTRAHGIAEQIARELVTPSMSADKDGEPIFDEIVRINYHCNQACAFCFVSTHLPSARDAQIEAAIRGAGERGARILLSGGEPTLNKQLLHWIALAKAVSRHSVCIQTNAVRLDDPALAQAIVNAGISEAFISLHGATADVCDDVTDTPGTFARSLVGVDNLHALGVEIVLNYVVCQANFHQFGDFIALVAARWPSVSVNCSFVAASTDLVPKEKRLIPRYSDVMPHLAAGLSLAEQRKVRITGFETMCGLPLCLIPASFDRERLSLTAIADGQDAGEFVKSSACVGCRYNDKCYGIRRGYADLHGTDELTALS